MDVFGSEITAFFISKICIIFQRKIRLLFCHQKPNAIVVGGLADLPSRHPPTSTWFHDNNLKIKSIQNGILAVTTIGRKYILDFGPGYTRDHFSWLILQLPLNYSKAVGHLMPKYYVLQKIRLCSLHIQVALPLNSYLTLVISRRFHFVTLRVRLIPTLP
ncbi:BAP_1a_G0014880.mRNA.1.CDS.1 [Saccharomyces cerevisiae]|nr:BAP_1a_G0014880.mRNA.1.CDS.1 [Saccharomyces cerevisiae]CAI7100612.1 BAP_1a_G0014880.mRNA.1.CDS.1 [Saccharomyces cerevisiae]